MNIVSGIATAPGISALLNAPRERVTASRTSTGTNDQTGRAAEAPSRRERPSGVPAENRVERAAKTAAMPALRGVISSGDPRMVRFVEAVQALRLDADTASTLPPDRLSRLRDAAKLVFKVARDIPREVRPTDSYPEPVQGEKVSATDEIVRGTERTGNPPDGKTSATTESESSAAEAPLSVIAKIESAREPASAGGSPEGSKEPLESGSTAEPANATTTIDIAT